MDMYVYAATYLSIAVFVLAVVVRYMRIQKYPINVRWEIYPVPHEGERALHGGSRLEDSEWWEKEQKKDKVMELKFMIQEMVFIKALREHNPELWRYSFPFHFGLYLMAAFAALVIAVALLGLAGVELGEGILMVIGVFGTGAAVLSTLGAVGLFAMRLTDVDMKPYSNFSHYFNLFFIIATLSLVIAVFATSGWSAAPFAAYVSGMLRFEVVTPEPLVLAAVLASSLLLAYIPLTHMSHFFVKWFTWHKIRWDDEPNVKGGRIEKLIDAALQYPVSWSADHIKGDGKKSWADVATEELKSE